MSVPVPTNTTIDIYRSGTAPPAAPAVAGVPCHLKADWCGGQEHGDKDRPTVNNYTHLALMDPSIDIRETWLASQVAGTTRKGAGKVAVAGNTATIPSATVAAGELLVVNIAFRCVGLVPDAATPTFNGQDMVQVVTIQNIITLANGNKLNLGHYYSTSSGTGDIVYDTSLTTNPATGIAINGSIVTGLTNITQDGSANSGMGTSCGPQSSSNPPDYLEAFAAVNNGAADEPNWSWQNPFSDANQVVGLDAGGGRAGNFFIADAYDLAEPNPVHMNYSGGTGGVGCILASYSQAATGTSNNPDIVYAPNKNGTPFYVVFVERVGKGTPFDHKRVYLQRCAGTVVPWPTSNL
jgi:hypothetical protein